MSENEDSTMSEESDAGTSRSHQKEDIPNVSEKLPVNHILLT